MKSNYQVPALAPRQERLFPASMAQMTAALFDEIECGLIVCDEQGGIHFANKAAQQEMASQRLLLRSGNTLRGAPGTIGLDVALCQAAKRDRRSLVRLTQAGDQLMVSVLPLQAQDVHTRQVLVMLGRRQPFSDLSLEMLANSYDLTLAERRVLSALVRQASPRQIASAHAVKLSTVRTQISSIRAKFGTRSIEGLLLRAAQVPPIAAVLRLPEVSSASASATPFLAAA